MIEKVNTVPMTKLGNQLQKNKLFKIGEILFLFVLAYVFILLIFPLAENNPILKQTVLWIANILMLIYVWIGLKLRRESWKDFGLTFKSISWRGGIKVLLLSLLVLVLALAGFIIGSIIMANITGITEGANMTGYDYLKDNIWMLTLTFAGFGYLLYPIEKETLDFNFSPCIYGHYTNHTNVYGK